MKKLISFFVPFIPILSIYKSPIPKVDLATFLICILFLVVIIYLKMKNIKITIYKKNSVINKLLLYCYYSIFVLLGIVFIGALNVNISTIVFRVLKFVVIIIFLNIILNNNLFDFEYSVKTLKKIVLASTLLIFIQYFCFYFLKKNIYGVIMPLILQGEYSYVDYNTMASYYLYRPCSFFLEPSSVSAYFSLYLSILLTEKKEKKYLLLALLITIAMIMTTSGQAYLYCVIIWGLFALKYFKNNLNKKTLFIGILCSVIFVLLIPKIYNIPFVYKAIQRIVDGSISGGNAVESRTFSFDYFSNLSSLFKMIGMGYGNPIPNVYFSSMSYSLYCSGILGCLIILNYFIKLFKHSENKIMILVWFISTIFSTTFVATSIGYYLPFLSHKDEVKNNE